MNSAEIKEISLAYNELFKSTKAYNNFRETLENRLEEDSFDKEQLEQIVKEFQKMLAALEKFERQLDKFEQFMSVGAFKNLKDALSNEKTIIGRICADAYGAIELNNPMYLESLMNSLESEKDITASFAKETTDFSNDLGFNLLMQAMDEKVSIQDLQLMQVAFESDSILNARIAYIIEIVEKRQSEKAVALEEVVDERVQTLDEDTNENVAVAAVEINEEEQVNTEEVEVAPKPSKPTLEEKIAAVNYQQGMNINATVQEISLESKLAEISAEIEQLQSKEKLTVRDKFKLRQLLEQQLAFEAYGESLEEQRVSRRERKRNKKLSSNSDKIENKMEELQDSIEQSQEYTSKTMRFLSERYQNKLSGKLQVLREKQGMLTDKQKTSAVARFDKKSKKLVRKAKRKGTIEQLRAYKDSIVQELQSIGQDVSRFFSTKEEDMETLSEATVVMPDNIISLDTRRRELTSGSLAA